MRSRKESPPAEIAADRDDEAEIGLDHLGLRRHVTTLDALREVDLLVGGQERHLPDLAQVEPQRVERGLDGEVELGAAAFESSASAGCSCGGDVLDALDELDPMVDQVGVEVLDLLLGQVDLFQPPTISS